MFATLYRDHHIEILDKPTGIPVISPRGGGASIASETGLLVVHRLDTGTSGCLVMARSLDAQRRLSAAFAEGRVEKRYLAVAVGVLPDEGESDAPIGDWKRGRVVVGKGRAAHTAWRVLWRDGERVGVELRPHTGRTHQLRAHLGALDAPILGDPTYGGPEADRLYLHAWRVVLPWPRPTDRLEVTSTPPPGFLAPG